MTDGGGPAGQTSAVRIGFEEFVESRRGRKLVRDVRRFAAPADADDIAQEMLLWAWLRWSTFADEDHAVHACITYARHRACDRARRASRFTELHEDVPQVAYAGGDPADAVVRHDECRGRWRAFRRLPAQSQAALVGLAFGASYDDLANRLAMTPVALRVRICRARATITWLANTPVFSPIAVWLSLASRVRTRRAVRIPDATAFASALSAGVLMFGGATPAHSPAPPVRAAAVRADRDAVDSARSLAAVVHVSLDPTHEAYQYEVRVGTAVGADVVDRTVDWVRGWHTETVCVLVAGVCASENTVPVCGAVAHAPDGVTTCRSERGRGTPRPPHSDAVAVAPPCIASVNVDPVRYCDPHPS